MGLRERRTQSPILQVPYVPFEHGVDEQLFGSFLGEQGVRGLIGPVQRQGGRVGDEEVVEVDAGVYLDEFVAHARPGEVVYPGGVGAEELGRPRGDPFGEAVVVFLRGRDLPAHDEEHYVTAGEFSMVFVYR